MGRDKSTVNPKFPVGKWRIVASVWYEEAGGFEMLVARYGEGVQN